MVKKIFKFRGKTLEELQELSINDFAKLVTARARRSLLRNKRDAQKTFHKKIEKKNDRVKTHSRDIVVLPNMVGKTIQIHNGKQFVQIAIQEEMVGHFLGEFSLTKSRVKHSAPGVGATRSSASVSVK